LLIDLLNSEIRALLQLMMRRNKMVASCYGQYSVRNSHFISLNNQFTYFVLSYAYLGHVKTMAKEKNVYMRH